MFAIIEDEYYDSERERFFESLNRECILFPTYAKRDSTDSASWIVKVKGWALSHNCSFAKQKMMMGITKSVAGKSSIDEDCSRMFEQRFKYFLATNKRNKQFLIQSIGTTTLEDSRLQLQKTQDTSQLQQAMYMLSDNNDQLEHESEEEYTDNEDKISYDEDDDEWNFSYSKAYYLEDPLLSRPSNPVSLLLDGSYKQPQEVLLPSSQEQVCGVNLRTKSSGFMSGQFHLSHDKILNWAQDQNHCEARLIQIQSTCLESSRKFSPNYGIVNLVEPIGISIISDIDDTIKDTQILSGARTVLSKTFFELPQGVSGMADAYMAWYSQGAAFHYVSNSPFQLLPMLDKFLRDSQFPPGSMHLRDDARLISRLVETPGQAKREAITQILLDFPQRKFVLIGDSGEIDLEIYTRIATEFPEQIIKIYIRDVTTPDPMKIASLKNKKKHSGRRRSSTLSSLFQSSKKRSQSLDIARNSSLTSETSESSEESIKTKKKFRSPLGMRRAVTTTLVEYAVEPHLTGHRNTVHIESKEQSDDDEGGLLEPHKKTISALEACAQLYNRVDKARLLIPDIDIILFQDAEVLSNDTDIRNALWDAWDDLSNSETTSSSSFYNSEEDSQRSTISSDSWY